MSISRTITGILSTIVLATGLSLVGMMPAQAYPSNCSAYISTDDKAYGNCTGGSGEYRIGIPCKNRLTGWHQYSSWMNVGQPAQVGCPFYGEVWWDIHPTGPSVLIEKRD